MRKIWEFIKKLCKRILPPPVHTFLREIDALRTEMAVREANLADAIGVRIQELSVSTSRIYNDARAERREMDARYAQLAGEVARLREEMREKTVFWSNGFERDVVRKNWGDVSALPDLAEKFLRLTAGMDEASVEQIVRILARQKAFLNSDQGRLDLFTREEQEELRRVKEELTDEILRLSDELYAWRHYLLPINCFEPSVFYYKHGIRQLKTAERVRGRTVLDVGGFIGDSALVLSELSPRQIVSFEAVPENFALLQRTIELNHLENVAAEPLALGAETGELTIHVAGSGSTSIERPGIRYTSEVTVPAMALDDYVERHQLRDIALIKVDIEGGEPAFLAGARRTITEQRPTLLLSIYHNAHDFFELKPLLESWDLGYKFSIHKPVHASASGETLLLAEIE